MGIYIGHTIFGDKHENHRKNNYLELLNRVRNTPDIKVITGETITINKNRSIRYFEN